MKTAASIFLFFASIFLLTGQGSIQSADGKTVFLLTQNIAENQSFQITQPVFENDSNKPRPVKYGIGMSLLALPFYVLGKGVASITGIGKEYATVFCVSMVNPLLTALSCLLIYLFGRNRFSFSHSVAFLLALGFGLSTIAWNYADDFMSEPVTTLLILFAVYFLTDKDESSRNKNILLAGSFLGMALTCRVATVVALPGFFIYLFLVWRENPIQKIEELLSNLVRFGLPIAFFVCVIFFYNYTRFGNIFETGYEKGLGAGFLAGLIGILFSPGKSIFLYNPIAITGVFCFPFLFKKHYSMGVLFGWIILAHLILFSFWHSWYGGFGWGPRLMLVVLPYIILPVGFLVKFKPAFFRKVLIPVVAVGIIIQIPSVTVSTSRYYYDLRSQLGDAEYHDKLLYDPQYSPLFWQAKEVYIVLSRFKEKNVRQELVKHVQAKTNFLGSTDSEVLEKGLAINAPNFWWVYMALLGYPVYMTYLPVICLLGCTIFSGSRIYKFSKNDWKQKL